MPDLHCDFEFHPEMFFILPMVGVQRGTCDDEACDAQHWSVSIGWRCWSLNIFG